MNDDVNGSRIHERPVFERLLFARCREDPELDMAIGVSQPGFRRVD